MSAWRPLVMMVSWPRYPTRAAARAGAGNHHGLVIGVGPPTVTTPLPLLVSEPLPAMPLITVKLPLRLKTKPELLVRSQCRGCRGATVANLQRAGEMLMGSVNVLVPCWRRSMCRRPGASTRCYHSASRDGERVGQDVVHRGEAGWRFVASVTRLVLAVSPRPRHQSRIIHRRRLITAFTQLVVFSMSHAEIRRRAAAPHNVQRDACPDDPDGVRRRRRINERKSAAEATRRRLFVSPVRVPVYWIKVTI